MNHWPTGDVKCCLRLKPSNKLIDGRIGWTVTRFWERYRSLAIQQTLDTRLRTSSALKREYRKTATIMPGRNSNNPRRRVVSIGRCNTRPKSPRRVLRRFISFVLVAEGLKNRDIASQLNLSENTARNYMLRIFDKLGMSNRVELALYDARQQI
jgi:DNA-binding NarL/FixJ family response regulator